MDDENKIKRNEMFAFNLWIFFQVTWGVYLILLLLPFDLLVDRYWLICIPTHIAISALYAFCMIKAYIWFITDDNPVIEDDFYKKLSITEMQKEINHKEEDGIAPDTGDLDDDIVKRVLSYKEKTM